LTGMGRGAAISLLLVTFIAVAVVTGLLQVAGCNFQLASCKF